MLGVGRCRVSPRRYRDFLELSWREISALVIVAPSSPSDHYGGALCVGTIGAIASNFSTQHFRRLDVDDTLDVFSSHGVGGVMGTLLTLPTGCFTTPRVAPGIHAGLFYGGTILIWRHP